MDGITVLSPIGVNLTEAQAIAARIPDLNGKTIGLVNNNKPNSRLLQDYIVGLLREKYDIKDVLIKQKPNAAVGAEGLADWAKEVDAVITALGDWGSCTSWCIHDSVDLEKLGVPTITVCTDVFTGLAKEEAKNLGMPDLPIAVVKHPLGGEPKEGVQERSVAALEQVLDGLMKDLL